MYAQGKVLFSGYKMKVELTLIGVFQEESSLTYQERTLQP
jgi:hypothetical protein